jgi:hypothetical protein
MSVFAMTGNLFEFRNLGCTVLTDKWHDEEGEPHFSMKVRANTSSCILMGYEAKTGLVRFNERTGKVVANTKVIQDFLSLDLDDVDAVAVFLQKYGFVVPISGEKYEELSFSDLQYLLLRLRRVLQLFLMMSESSSVKDYNALFQHTYGLLLGRTAQIAVGGKESCMASCPHPITFVWNQPLSIAEREETEERMDAYPELVWWKRTQESIVFHGESIQKPLHTAGSERRLLSVLDPVDTYYKVEDSFSGRIELVSYIRYHELTGDMSDESKSECTTQGGVPVWETERIDASWSYEQKMRARLVYLYKNADQLGETERCCIELLIHMIDDISQVEWDPEWGPALGEGVDLNHTTAFDDRYKSALEKLAKRTVKREVEHFLRGVRPLCEEETMKPLWHIPDLLAAMCFSVFYMGSDMIIYRRCANPKCGKMFQVSTTNRKKKYCDQFCQQAVSRQRHYQRQKSKQRVREEETIEGV